MKAAFKIWLDNNGKAFGDGPCRLLKLVESTGSLRKAALEMGMSYRKAWLTLQRCEERLGFPLLQRRVGGSMGGGSELTKAGKELIEKYERFRKEAAQALRSSFDRCFGPS